MSAYRAAHGRLWRARGKASAHACHQCGAPAHHWAYDHNDPNERTDKWHGHTVVYSDDPSHYRPMCRSCHNRLDFRGYEGSALQQTNQARSGPGSARWTKPDGKPRGSTTAWRKVRQQVLDRDRRKCRIRIPGVCTTTATQVHHTDTAMGDDPRYLVASCRPCNLRGGPPTTRDEAQTPDPTPIGRRQW